MSVAKNVGFGLRCAACRRRKPRARRARAEAGAADRPGAQAARAALRRPAAARGDRARDRHRAAADPDGRAAVEPRRQAAHRDARRNPPHPPRARPRDDLRHARPGRGAVAGRPHRRDEGRRRAADRQPRRVYAQPRTCTSRASWAIATCSSSTSSARTGRASRCAAPASRSTGMRKQPLTAARVRWRSGRKTSRRRPAPRTRSRAASRTSSTAAAIRWSTSSRPTGRHGLRAQPARESAPGDVARVHGAARARARLSRATERRPR